MSGQHRINPQNEVIDVVLPSSAVEAVFEAMIEAGQLETPGNGYTYDWGY